MFCLPSRLSEKLRYKNVVQQSKSTHLVTRLTELQNSEHISLRKLGALNVLKNFINLQRP